MIGVERTASTRAVLGVLTGVLAAGVFSRARLVNGVARRPGTYPSVEVLEAEELVDETARSDEVDGVGFTLYQSAHTRGRRLKHQG